MKCVIKMLFVASLVVLGACSKETNSMNEKERKQVEQEVLDAFDELVLAARELNTERYFALFDHRKFVGLNADGTNWNSIEELRALIEPGFAALDKVESLSFSNVRVSVIDQHTAILVNEFEQVVSIKEGGNATSYGGGTQVWSKASGDWKLVSVSASNKPQ